MASDEKPKETPKRPRPVVSCLNCRRKKLKCDRLLPCQQCNKSGISKECAYAPGQEPDQSGTSDDNAVKRRRLQELNQTSSPVLEVSSTRFDELQARVRQLEHALQSHQEPRSSTGEEFPTNISTASLPTSVRFGSQCLISERQQLASLDHHLIKKPFVASLGRADCPQELSTVAADIRVLHEVLRLSPPPVQASYTKISDVLSHMHRLLPDAQTCLALVNLYFEYFENCFRILHKPSATSIFQAFWNNTLDGDERNACLPLLLSVISVGSSLGTLSECHQPNLHGNFDGIGAYQLIRNYLDLLMIQEWKKLSNIQIAVLSLGLHNSCPLQPTDSWLWSGHVLRRAMAAGLHNFSATITDAFEVEIRRKLWLTILEQDLTISIASNMPPNCPQWQGLPPTSVNDHELLQGMNTNPQCRNVEEWTDGICQYVLAQSFNERLESYSLVSAGKSLSYAELLQHTRRLEQIIHDLPQCFRFGLADDASNTPSRLVAQMGMDFLLRRPLNACYAPWAALMPSDDVFKEARILWIQNCTFGACFQDLFDPKYPLIDLPHPEGLWDLYYNVYDWDNFQFFLSSCLELQRLRSLDPSTTDSSSTEFVRQTLRSTVRIPGWTIESLIKSIEEQIDAFIRRVGRHKSSLRFVVRWVAIIGSLRINRSCDRHHAMKNELQSLVATLKNRFPRECDRFESQISPPGAGWNDCNNKIWLQRYLHQEVDDIDLEPLPTTTLRKQNNLGIHSSGQKRLR